MKCNYVINTGSVSIADSQSDPLHKNQRPFFGEQLETITHFRLDEDGNEKKYPFSFDDTIVTGSNTSFMSLNSQTLLESSSFNITDGKSKNYYTVPSSDFGSYFVDVENSRGKIIFDPVLDLNNLDVIFYDKKNNSQTFTEEKTSIAIGSFNTSLSSLLSTVDSQDPTSSIQELEEKYFLFFNGQKVVNFNLSTDLDDVTGILFVFRKDTHVKEVTGVFDVYGEGFVENNFDFYLNGMEQDNQDFIQINTGVYMIETGVNASFTLVNPNKETYQL